MEQTGKRGCFLAVIRWRTTVSGGEATRGNSSVGEVCFRSGAKASRPWVNESGLFFSIPMIVVSYMRLLQITCIAEPMDAVSSWVELYVFWRSKGESGAELLPSRVAVWQGRSRCVMMENILGGHDHLQTESTFDHIGRETSSCDLEDAVCCDRCLSFRLGLEKLSTS
ncbi:hypothetical protein ACSQ67_021100 [Phaseolus vulgaris]